MYSAEVAILAARRSPPNRDGTPQCPAAVQEHTDPRTQGQGQPKSARTNGSVSQVVLAPFSAVPGSSRLQGTPGVGPFEGFGENGVEVIDEGEHSLSTPPARRCRLTRVLRSTKKVSEPTARERSAMRSRESRTRLHQ